MNSVVSATVAEFILATRFDGCTELSATNWRRDLAQHTARRELGATNARVGALLNAIARPLPCTMSIEDAGIGAELAVQYGLLGARLVLAARRKPELEAVSPSFFCYLRLVLISIAAELRGAGARTNAVLSPASVCAPTSVTVPYLPYRIAQVAAKARDAGAKEVHVVIADMSKRADAENVAAVAGAAFDGKLDTLIINHALIDDTLVAGSCLSLFLFFLFCAC